MTADPSAVTPGAMVARLRRELRKMAGFRTISNHELAPLLRHALKVVWELRRDVARLESRVVEYVKLTRTLEEHPEGFDEWCECATCLSYADLDDGEGGRIS